jgi:hypothetical protein
MLLSSKDTVRDSVVVFWVRIGFKADPDPGQDIRSQKVEILQGNILGLLAR